MDSHIARVDIADYEWEPTRARLRAPESVNETRRQAKFKFHLNPKLQAAAEDGDVDKFIEALKAYSHKVGVCLSNILMTADILQALLEVIHDNQLATKVNYQGDTALHVAARKGRIRTAKLLLRYDGSILDMENYTGNTALHEAVKNSCHDLTRLLLRQGSKSVYKKNKGGKCPLYLAVEMGDLDGLKYLMENVVGQVIPSQNEGMSPVHGAVIHKKIVMLKEMSEQNEDLFNLKDAGGGTPLHLATLMDYVEGVNFLVDKFAWSAFEFDNEGYLPIHVACKMGHLKTMRKLLQHWPNPEELLDRKEGQNILHIAAKYGKVDVVDHTLAEPKLEKLINAKDTEGNTPLHVATLQLQYIVLSRLVFHGKVDLKLINDNNLTARDIADEQPNLFGRRPETEGHGRNPYARGDTHSAATFAAGFSVPGGYNGPGSDAGYATLLNKPMYDVFVICNTISLYSSLIAIIAVAILHWAESDAVRVLKFSRPPVVTALSTMTLAFMAGVYVTVSKRIWIAIVALIAGSTALFVILGLHIALTGSKVNKHVCIYFSFLSQLDIHLSGSSRLKCMAQIA
ncbi:ankyrin-1-like [Eucalyptus grandis]|uniref:ankyrin-1-like n=1 Tax=Eucalyptus grandis TaxID=71139 RepID=UPI00192EBCF0|nr:ankyrin-1-like [Eucalyptus grandis]